VISIFAKVCEKFKRKYSKPHKVKIKMMKLSDFLKTYISVIPDASLPKFGMRATAGEGNLYTKICLALK